MEDMKSDSLAVAVHRNNDGAIERLVRVHQDALFSYALRLLRDRFEAEEVTQDAFLRAIRALTTQYDEEKCTQLALKPWLYRITRNLAYNRRKARRPVHDVQSGSCEGAETEQTAWPVADRALEQDERFQMVDRALAGLSAEARDLILLRFMEEMSYAEIAEASGLGESSVRGKVFRALRALRKTLERMEGAQ